MLSPKDKHLCEAIQKGSTFGPRVVLTIPGRPIVKKNTKRVFGSGRHKRFCYTPKYLAWEQTARLAHAKAPKVSLIDYACTVVYRFYFKNKQGEADVSNLCEGPGDILKKVGAIQDDKLIVKIIAEKFFGEEPRTEVEIYKHGDI